MKHLQDRMVFHSAFGLELADAFELYRSAKFGPELRASMLATNYAPEAWGGLDLVNDSRAGTPANYVITLHIPLASAVDVYLIRQDGPTENLLNFYAFDPFSPEDHSVTGLRTPTFELAPQETVSILVHFRFGPFQSFAMALETPEELNQPTFMTGIRITAFYAFGLSCLIFFLGFHLAMKNWTGVYYSLMFLVGLSLIAYTDDLWFRFSFPDNPEWQSAVGFFHLFALSGIGFLAAGQAMASKGTRTPQSRLVSLLAIVSLAGFGGAILSPGTYAAAFGFLLLVLMFATLFYSGIDWRRADGRIHPVFLVIGGLTAVSVAIALAIIVASSHGASWPMAILFKGLFAVLAAGTMSALTGHIIAMRRDHQTALQKQMLALEQEAQRSQELLVAERNFRKARDLANLRQRQLATASHDLRQPLASLRMTFDGLAAAADPNVRARFNDAFDYMDALSRDYLRVSAPDTEEDEPPEEEGTAVAPIEQEEKAADQEGEAYPIGLIVSTVQQMFKEEAVSKGIQLRAVPSSLQTTVPALILMRIISNLVSNAVKYTESGRVLVGVRRRGIYADFLVLDTGAGMSDEELLRFKTAYQKPPQSEGHGLGLAVCFELAARHGLELTVSSQQAGGTLFTLRLRTLNVSISRSNTPGEPNWGVDPITTGHGRQ